MRNSRKRRGRGARAPPRRPRGRSGGSVTGRWYSPAADPKPVTSSSWQSLTVNVSSKVAISSNSTGPQSLSLKGLDIANRLGYQGWEANASNGTIVAMAFDARLLKLDAYCLSVACQLNVAPRMLNGLLTGADDYGPTRSDVGTQVRPAKVGWEWSAADQGTVVNNLGNTNIAQWSVLSPVVGGTGEITINFKIHMLVRKSTSGLAPVTMMIPAPQSWYDQVVAEELEQSLVYQGHVNELVNKLEQEDSEEEDSLAAHIEAMRLLEIAALSGTDD